jgi:hypothetical protein
MTKIVSAAGKTNQLGNDASDDEWLAKEASFNH